MIDPLTPSEQAQLDQVIEMITQAIARTMFHHATPEARLFAAAMMKTDITGEDWPDAWVSTAIHCEPQIHFESVPGAFVCVSEMFESDSPHRGNHAAGVVVMRAAMRMFAQAMPSARAEAMARVIRESESMRELARTTDFKPFVTIPLAPSAIPGDFVLSDNFVAIRDASERAASNAAHE